MHDHTPMEVPEIQTHACTVDTLLTEAFLSCTTFNSFISMFLSSLFLSYLFSFLFLLPYKNLHVMKTPGHLQMI